MRDLHLILARWTAFDRPLRHLSRTGAVVLLAAIALALAWSAASTAGPSRTAAEQQAGREDSIGDLALYAAINDRAAAGEGYYEAALAEQRANDYPTRPFVTVRLPTLGMANAAFGQAAMGAVAIALLFGNVLAWQARLAGAARPERIAAVVLVFLAGFGAFEARAGLMHELVAGLLLSLALALYRPSRWWPALAALAAALAVRELALPFALLWLAFAAAERRWHEARAVAGVIALFALALAAHYLAVEAHRLPGDLPSPGWDAMLGPAFVLHALTRLTALLFLPPWLAAPLALLPLVGWIALGGRVGLFAVLWFTGFALAMAVFARAGNFYWAMVMLPAWMAGLAFVPRAFADLVAAASRRAAIAIT